MIRYRARWVLPISSPPIEDGAVAVEGTTIAYVGPLHGAPAGHDEDFGNALLMPGLVNAHCHLELTAMRDAARLWSPQDEPDLQRGIGAPRISPRTRLKRRR